MYIHVIMKVEKVALMKVIFWYIRWISKILNNKTQNIFYCVIENSTSFLYNLNRGNKKTEGEKESFFKVYNKVEMLLTKKFGF